MSDQYDDEDFVGPSEAELTSEEILRVLEHNLRQEHGSLFRVIRTSSDEIECFIKNVAGDLDRIAIVKSESGGSSLFGESEKEFIDFGPISLVATEVENLARAVASRRQ